MIIFIIGGAKSGKSDLAEHVAKQLYQQGNLYYLATMSPYDDEDRERIKNHLQKRENTPFKTIEAKRDLQEILHTFESEDTLLLDSLTSWMTNEMFIGATFNPHVNQKMMDILNEFRLKYLVIVSDYVFSDAIQYDEYTDIFKRELGHLNCEIAKLSDAVIECVYGNPIIHKGKEVLNEKLMLRP